MNPNKSGFLNSFCWTSFLSPAYAFPRKGDYEKTTAVTQVIAIATGGAIGALLRFWMSTSVVLVFGRAFPYGTLAVNVLGSLVMGFLYVYLIDKLNVSAEWRAALLIGLLGSFTTFSTFSIETLNLIEQGAQLKAALNILLSVVMCLGAAWIGVLAGRQL